MQTRRIVTLLAPLALAACAPSPAPDPRLARLVNELRVAAAFHAEATELAWLCRPDSRAAAHGLNTEGRRVAACERLLDLLTGQDPSARVGGAQSSGSTPDALRPPWTGDG